LSFQKKKKVQGCADLASVQGICIFFDFFLFFP